MAQKVVWVHEATDSIAGGGVGKQPVEQVGDVRRRRVALEIDTRIDRLPPFPAILTELIGLTGSDQSAAKDLQGVIQKDPVLTAKLLKLANSAFYSPRSPVSSIQKAVVMLGQLSVKSLAMAAATMKLLGRRCEPYGMGAGGLWLHSYSAAELAKELARTEGDSKDVQEAVYVGALLHDIGKIVLTEIIEGMSRSGIHSGQAKEGETIQEWEERVTGFAHNKVGRLIADKWRLSPLTTNCVQYHHGCDPETPKPDNEYAREIMLVTLADAGVRRLGMGLHSIDENPEREQCLLEALNIPDSRFNKALESYAEKSAEAGDILSSLKGGES